MLIEVAAWQAPWRSARRPARQYPPQVSWEPTEQEVQEKLIELAYTWGDIEEELEVLAARTDFEPDDYQARFWDKSLPTEVSLAFRVEAQFGENGFGDPCTFFVLYYDVTDNEARATAKRVEGDPTLRRVILNMAHPWHNRDFLLVKQVPRTAPVGGQICRRRLEEHPANPTPSLDDVPSSKPESSVELVERDGYWLTPIEVPFYEALRETGLFFAVQPWVQGTDRRYRLDFLVFYGGSAVAVELDGHDWHKTKEQRGHDAARDRWFAARKVTTLRFTGSQVFADPQGCVSELLNILRAAPARP